MGKKYMTHSVKIILLLVVLPIFLIFLFSYRSSVLNRASSVVVTQSGSPSAICTTLYEPVCGEDGITYSNKCRAALSRAQVAYLGVCKDSESISTAFSSGLVDSTGSLVVLPSNSQGSGSTHDTSLTAKASTVVSGEQVSTSSVSGEMGSTGTGIRLSTYYSIPFSYGFSIPLGDYYQGFGKQLSAIHTVGIKHKEPVSTFENADVRVYLFGGILPELSQAKVDRFDDTEHGRIYLRLGNRSVVIESSDLSSQTVMTILATINAGN